MSSLMDVQEQKGDVRHPHIVFILDRSGSMSGIRDAMVMAINELITEQKKTDDNTVVSMVTFSAPDRNVNEYMTFLYERSPLRNVQHLTPCDYECRGGTALYDAIGEILIRYRGNPDTMVVIVTDGEDLDSTRHTQESVKTLIDERKDTDPQTGESRGWKFIFLSSDPTSVRRAETAGLQNARGITSTQSAQVDYQHLAPALSRQVSAACAAYRQTSAIPDLTQEFASMSVGRQPVRSHTLNPAYPTYSAPNQFLAPPPDRKMGGPTVPARSGPPKLSFNGIEEKDHVHAPLLQRSLSSFPRGFPQKPTLRRSGSGDLVNFTVPDESLDEPMD